MSILDRFAKPYSDHQNNKKRTLSVRIPADLYEQFQETCRKNGLTMSEGIRILLELDLRGKTLSLHRSARARTPRTAPTTSSGKRWTIVPYLNPDGSSFDCPICGKTISRSNAARHAQTHGLSTAQDLFESTQKDPDQA